MKTSTAVIKIGTSTIAHKSGLINIRRVEELVKVLSDIKNSGMRIVIVSSGAVGVGMGKLHLTSRPKDMPSKQALAAVGQCELMYIYDKLFGEYNHLVAQVLLTKDVVSREDDTFNVQNTFEKLLKMNVVPIVNENDTVCTQEIEFGDNDNLSALVAHLVGADKLIIVSDIDGLYTENPNVNSEAKKLEVVETIDESIFAFAKAEAGEMGTGGMLTKIQAADYATKMGIETVIISGKDPKNLYKVFDRENVGTRFLAKKL